MSAAGAAKRVSGAETAQNTAKMIAAKMEEIVLRMEERLAPIIIDKLEKNEKPTTATFTGESLLFRDILTNMISIDASIDRLDSLIRRLDM